MSDLKFLDLHGDRIAYRDEGSAEALLLIHAIDLCHDAVDFKGQRIALLLPLFAERGQLVDIAALFPMLVDLQAARFEFAQGR